MVEGEPTAGGEAFRPPWSALVGVETPDSDGASALLRYSPELTGDPKSGILHGGAITTLLDHCCGRAAAYATGDIVATLDLRIDYMRPNLPDQDVRAEAKVERITRSAVFLRATAFQETPDRAIASATGVFFRRALPGGQRERATMFHRDMDVRLPPPSPTAADPDSSFTEMADGILRQVPFAQMLGVRAYNTGGRLVAHLPYRPELVGNIMLPALHGGAVGAFLEVSSLLHAQCMTDIQSPLIPISVTLDYLRSAQAKDCFAEVQIHRQGRSIVNLVAKAWQTDPSRPVTALHGNFLIAAPQDGERN